MEDREIIERLRREAEEHTPDVAPDPRAVRLEAPGETVVLSSRKKALLIAASAALLILAIVLAVVFPVFFGERSPDLFTTVVISINPSAELTVSEGRVTKTKPLNRDAAVLLASATLDGLTPEEACLEFTRLAGARNLIGADGVRIRVTGKDEAALSESIFGALDSLFTVGQLDDASLDALLGSYDEETMERFEDYVSREYADKREEYLARTKELLKSYPADLTALDLADRAAVENFNRTYLALGEDFLVDSEDEDDDDADEIKEDLLEEYGEIMELIERDPEKAFEELFEEFLELFEQDYDDD